MLSLPCCHGQPARMGRTRYLRNTSTAVKPLRERSPRITPAPHNPVMLAGQQGLPTAPQQSRGACSSCTCMLAQVLHATMASRRCMQR